MPSQAVKKPGEIARALLEGGFRLFEAAGANERLAQRVGRVGLRRVDLRVLLEGRDRLVVAVLRELRVAERL